MARKTVYISGPITLGDKQANYDQAIEAQRVLMLAGFAPFNPILSMQLPWGDWVEHSIWLECDLPWVNMADCLLRLPGESNGADIEVSHALIHDVPVFHSISEIESWGEE